MSQNLKFILIQILSSIILIFSMLLGIFAAAGFCALVWGSQVLDNELGGTPDRLHPAFITFMVLMLPGMLIGSIGAIFGVILPLHFKFKVKLGKSNRSLVMILSRYCKSLNEFFALIYRLNLDIYNFMFKKTGNCECTFQ